MFLAALLICTENTFWDISRDHDDNFVELFEESFLLYVESGMREMTERDIDIFRNEQGEFSTTKDFSTRFYKFIIDHYLRKFHFFYSHSTYLITVYLPTKIQPNLGIPGPGQVENPMLVRNKPPENQPVENCTSVPVGVNLKFSSWNKRTEKSLLGFKS